MSLSIPLAGAHHACYVTSFVDSLKSPSGSGTASKKKKVMLVLLLTICVFQDK